MIQKKKLFARTTLAAAVGLVLLAASQAQPVAAVSPLGEQRHFLNVDVDDWLIRGLPDCRSSPSSRESRVISRCLAFGSGRGEHRIERCYLCRW